MTSSRYPPKTSKQALLDMAAWHDRQAASPLDDEARRAHKRQAAQLRNNAEDTPDGELTAEKPK